MGASGIERTPCGRIPNTPLRNARHEIIVHAVVCGKTARAAGIDAGFKDGPSLDGNVTRILHRPEVRERLTEVAASSAGLAGIYSAWVLSHIKLGAKSNIACFFRRDANGNIEFDCNGLPVLDFRSATEEQMRTTPKGMSHELGRFGRWCIRGLIVPSPEAMSHELGGRFGRSRFYRGVTGGVAT
jgi:hypothetical protein